MTKLTDQCIIERHGEETQQGGEAEMGTARTGV